MNPASKFLTKLKSTDIDDVLEEVKPQSQRAFRRAKRRDTLSITRRYHKDVDQQERAFNKVSTLEAVRRVREWEVDNGPALEHLFAFEKITRKQYEAGMSTLGVAGILGLLEEKDEDNDEAAR